MRRALMPFLAALLAGCAALPSHPLREEEPLQLAEASLPQAPPPSGSRHSSTPRWPSGAVAVQGYLGAVFYDMQMEGGDTGSLDVDATFPTMGGGVQWKLAGDGIDLGLEGLLSFAWQGDIKALASGGGGATAAVEAELLVFDFYGGPFASVFLGDYARIYAGAGPLLEWGSFEQEGPSATTSGDGSGFGLGWYARTGVEFWVSHDTMLGLGVHWTDTTLDLNSGLGDLEVQGLQVYVTATQGF